MAVDLAHVVDPEEAEHLPAASTRPATRLTWWSLLTIGLALPVWASVVVGGVMGRSSDTGIFLSVSAELRRGLDLYSQVWDNKDPLFYLMMATAGVVSPAGPFVMDWLWVPVASLGGWLIARRCMSGDRALLTGLVVVPFVLTSPFYLAGHTTLPGTAGILLALGLVLNRRPIAGGIVLGLVAFLKLVLWPIGVGCVVAVLLFSERRHSAERVLVAMGAALAGFVAVLASIGWLGPYLDALDRNRAYSSEVMRYRGYPASPGGHLEALVASWTIADWISVAAVGAVLVIALVWWATRHGATDARVVIAWLGIAAVGSVAVMAWTYAWPHHAQAVYLPAVLAVVVLGALLPTRLPLVVAQAALVVGAWAASGAGTPSAALDRANVAYDRLEGRWAAIHQVPVEARLLNAVPMTEFSFARLGVNDDGGALAAVREGGHLGCPQFHLYASMPPEDFARTLACLDTVEVVIKSRSFDKLAAGRRAASARPILEFLDGHFDCRTSDGRALCIREDEPGREVATRQTRGDGVRGDPRPPVRSRRRDLPRPPARAR